MIGAVHNYDKRIAGKTVVTEGGGVWVVLKAAVGAEFGLCVTNYGSYAKRGVRRLWRYELPPDAMWSDVVDIRDWTRKEREAARMLELGLITENL